MSGFFVALGVLRTLITGPVHCFTVVVEPAAGWVCWVKADGLQSVHPCVLLCFSFLLLSFDCLGLHNLIENGIKILTVLLLLNTEKRYLVAEKDKTLGCNSFVEFSFRLNILMNR